MCDMLSYRALNEMKALPSPQPLCYGLVTRSHTLKKKNNISLLIERPATSPASPAASTATAVAGEQLRLLL